MKQIFTYITDTDKFFNEETSRQYSLDTAKKFLTDRGQQPSEALNTLIGLMEFGIDSEELRTKNSKRKKKKPSFRAMYEEVKGAFPILIYTYDNSNRQYYFEKDNKQVSFVDDEISGLVHAVYNSKKHHDILKAYYEEELTEDQKDSISFISFLETMVDQHLRMDWDKRLEYEPSVVSWNPDEYALNKINLDSFVEGETPAWNEFLSRLDYPELFMAWVWSIIEPTNTVRQVLWIKGAGQDGKSVVQKVLASYLGDHATHSMREGDMTSNFFLGSVFGKLLVTYPDCKNPHLIKDEAIKQITGGDRVSVEKKGIQAKSGVIRAKIFATSNKDPRINPESRFQTSRILKLTLKPQNERTNDFEQSLLREMPQFLFRCQEAFEVHATSGKDNIHIPGPILEKMLHKCSSGSYLHAKEFEKQFMEYGPDYTCTISEFNKALKQYQIENDFDSKNHSWTVAELNEILSQKDIELAEANEEVSGAHYPGFRIKKGKVTL